MTAKTTILILCLFPCVLTAQTPAPIIDLGPVEEAYNLDDFKQLDALFEGVEVVMLGEQSHGEGVVYQSKLKLIKYLHEQLGFDVLAFESSFYGCDRAWRDMQEGLDAETALCNSLHQVWPYSEEFKGVSAYLDEQMKAGTPLQIAGFDPQLSFRYGRSCLLTEFAEFYVLVDSAEVTSASWAHLKTNLEYLGDRDFRSFKKNDPASDIAYLDKIILRLRLVAHPASALWTQVAENLKVYFSDVGLGTDNRDEMMADNLLHFLRYNSGKKVICWGATSHFIFNSETVRMKNPTHGLMGGNYYKRHQMMGDYVKDELGPKAITIGFSAIEGRYGFFRKKDLKPPKQGSLEADFASAESDHFLIDLDSSFTKGRLSRPLGNLYIKTDVSQIMDLLIIHRVLTPSTLDRELYEEVKQRPVCEEGS
ncbi:erythromycin esterase family protein [Sanyastnella coralliicola]|uniref:erythromycin esterase family protein n=1 Tax=Sanyastnella coralliicola TaxID=3069118 RepID=UPI0027B99C63|nr:erythromycin esterase family protein [Longitalea sp. SCSIO 12813]